MVVLRKLKLLSLKIIMKNVTILSTYINIITPHNKTLNRNGAFLVSSNQKCVKEGYIFVECLELILGFLFLTLYTPAC